MNKLPVFLIIVFFLPLSYAWSNLSGGDHGGADWTPASGTYISGVHTNVGTFTVANGRTVYVQKYTGSFGSVEVQADDIYVYGTLDASGKGYSGGNGGAGAPGGYAGGEYCGAYGSSGSSGSGSYKGSGGSGGAGNPSCIRSFNGGSGGSGSAGKYCNGATSSCDASTDESISMGSGGGGGGGGGAGSRYGSNNNYPAGTGGGGGAGGSGGGIIKLVAEDALVVSGVVKSRGVYGENGATGGKITNCGDRYRDAAGGSGGSGSSTGSGSGGSGTTADVNQLNSENWCGGRTNTRGGNGGSGAAGAGGGILLKGGDISVSGTVDSRNAASSSTYGGTLKVFYCDYSKTGSYYTGRTYTSKRTDCEIDIGLRLRENGQNVAIAVYPLGQLNSPLRIRHEGNTYAVVLVSTSHSKASKVKIRTGGQTYALKKM